MLVNKANVSAMFTALKGLFNVALASAKPQWKWVAMEVPSTTSVNDYTWLSSFPRLREWLGDKVVKSLAAHSYTVANRDFEATIAVRRSDMEDDQLGAYNLQTKQAGVSAAQHPDELVFELINNGFTATCYDGQYFFDTDHPGVDKDGNVVSVSNKGVAPLDASTYAAAQASYGAARTALAKMRDDEGKPLAIRPNILLVPPALADVANMLMVNDKLEDGKPNPYKGTATVVECPYLDSDTAWFLLDTTQVLKPFFYQKRKAPVFVKQVDTDSDNVFMRGEYRFGVEARGAAGYGLWQQAYGSTGEGA